MKIHKNNLYTLYEGNCLSVFKKMKSESIQCCITSPPYWGLRDYGEAGQLGLEATPEEYIAKTVKIFNEVKRVLRDDGTLWLNLGDSYCATTKDSGGHNQKQDTNKGAWHENRKWQIPRGLKPKDLCGIPWRVALALQAGGWYLRSDIIWHKPNPMLESVTDRPTKSHEYIFLMSKRAKYYYDADAIKEKTVTSDDYHRDRDSTKLNNVPGRSKMKGLKTNNYEYRNKRSVWTVASKSYAGAHFATFPLKLIEPCVLAGSKKGDTILDPFAGTSVTGMAALLHKRKYIGIELNPESIELSKERLDFRNRKYYEAKRKQENRNDENSFGLI